MLTFNELKPIISKCCYSGKSNDLSEKYHFSVDFKKLENDLENQNEDLHVMSFADKVESRIPTVYDIQLLSEYAHKQETTSSMFFNGTSEFVSFMLYSTKDGDLWKEDDIESLIEDDIYETINGEEKNLDLINYIIDNAPLYYVVVIKRFNQAKERFDYNIFFRYNSSMNNIVRGKSEE